MNRPSRKVDFARCNPRIAPSVRRGARGVESDAGNVEIFLEAVELEKVGEFEHTDVTASRHGFPFADSA